MIKNLKSLIILFCTIGQAHFDPGVCNKSSHDGETKRFCCDFFEKKNTGCIACDDGFESTNGDRCTPCFNNRYGKGCVDTCMCLASKRCDYIYGCVDMLTTVDFQEGTSRMIKPFVTVQDSSNNQAKHDTKVNPLLVYIVTASSITLIFVSAICIIIRRRRRQLFKDNLRVQRQNRIAYVQSQSEENEQYITIL
ncbi:uncharacterized protein LOC134697269 [Mytilus trossulus]|uniref:uncharacterized protein LOC134697269 n=1 Tax=Mytilus trossulus TaxID=6551 RepID=UPI0030056584